MECNVGISEAQNIYGKTIKKLIVETRVKLLTDMKPGSRGWGLWKSRKTLGAHSLAWFMQQLAPDNAPLNWQLAGTVNGKKRQTVEWQADLKRWHVYRIERDLTRKTTFFYLDGQMILKTPGLVPSGRLSFHLWIDNQVYSQKGILRTGWSGENALVVDYVKIITQSAAPPEAHRLRFPALLFHKTWNDVLTGNGQFNIAQIPFTSPGDTVYCLINARLESYDGYDTDDVLFFFLDDASNPVQTLRPQRQNNQTQSYLIPLNLKPGKHVLGLSGQTTPVIYDLFLLNGSQGRWLLNKQNLKITENQSDFQIHVRQGKPLLIYCAVTVDEANDFNHLGPKSQPESNDQDLQVLVQNADHQTLKTFSFCGNQLFGECRSNSFVFTPQNKVMNIRLKAQGKPLIHRLFVFQLN